MRFTCLLIVLSLAVFGAHASIWDRLLNPALSEHAMPITADAAAQAGLVTDGQCDPVLGIAYTTSGGLGSLNPRTLYFTAAGQIQGVGLTIWDAPDDAVSDYWVSSPIGSAWTLNVGFRNTSMARICSPGWKDGNTIGDSIIVAPTNAAQSVPLLESDAAAQGWTNGSCLGSMGRHWGWDVTGSMTWEITNLMPVMPMYMNGNLVTFLIQTPTSQVFQPLGDWDAIFPTALFCLNFCGCQYSGLTTVWSTSHFFLTDPALNTCPSGRCG